MDLKDKTAADLLIFVSNCFQALKKSLRLVRMSTSENDIRYFDVVVVGGVVVAAAAAAATIAFVTGVA